MSADERKLIELASLVSDGTSVDWDKEEAGAADDKELQQQIRHLRLVSHLASVHRTADLHSLPTVSPTEMSTTVDLDNVQAKSKTGEPAPTPAPPKNWGRLEIRQKLGEGGFGEVFRAFDSNLDRDVALKLLKPGAGSVERVDAILEEGRMLAKVRHPNVIMVHGAEVHDDRVGMWMEFVRGNTLAKLINEQGRFSAREAALIGVDLCRAMAAVHRAGLVHRDIKPENAMRDEDGRYLLMDFGAGQRLEDLAQRSTRRISGTPLYIAPEIFLGQSATPQSDVYSMGVLLYHLVTAAYPVVARSLEELKQAHQDRHSNLLRDERSDLPEAFVSIVERALSWDPADRYETAGRMEQALASSLGIEGSPSAVPESRSNQSVGKIVGGVLAAAALAAVVWFGVTQLRHESPTSQPATTSAAVPKATDSYTVQASLYRLQDTATGGKQREKLNSGDQLQLGDELSLEVQASRELYVYILNEDSKGNAFALFPLEGFELQNPLPAGTWQLPGPQDGDQMYWQVSSPGEREHLIVLASPEPLDEFEQEMRRLERPQSGAMAMAIPPETKERLRGIGGLAKSTGSNRPANADPLFKMARRLAGHAEEVEGVWMREIELANPAP